MVGWRDEGDGGMKGWRDGGRGGWREGWNDGWMGGWVGGWMDEWMEGRKRCGSSRVLVDVIVTETASYTKRETRPYIRI